MSMGTFVVHHIVELPTGKAFLKTEESRIGETGESEPDGVFTSLRLTEEPGVAGFLLARLTHRHGVELHGLWHGHDVRNLVAVRQFNAFYSRKERLFVSHTEREIAQSAIRRLNKELPRTRSFRLEKVKFDLARIMSHAKSIEGAWFQRKQAAPIRTQAAFGSRIPGDPEYDHMARLGTLRNVTLMYPIHGKTLKVNVSAEGSVFFMGKCDLKRCVGLVVELSKFADALPPPIGSRKQKK